MLENRKISIKENGLFKIDNIENPNNFILDGCYCGIIHITTLADGTVCVCKEKNTCW